MSRIFQQLKRLSAALLLACLAQAPAAHAALLRHDAALEQFVAHALYAAHEEALAYLARYEINSDYAALEPAALLIGPGRRASVGKTLRSCGFDSLPIYISPWLAPRAWYLLPKDHPALIRLVGKDREAPEVHWSGDSLTITLYRQFRLASRAIYQGGAGHD